MVVRRVYLRSYPPANMIVSFSCLILIEYLIRIKIQLITAHIHDKIYTEGYKTHWCIYIGIPHRLDCGIGHSLDLLEAPLPVVK
jgi:hypothetical protein